MGRGLQPRTRIKRFWAKVDIQGPDDCWPWLGGKRGRDEYGCCYWHASRVTGARAIVPAHRKAWELTYGNIEDPDLCVCHKCDNPPCCNPAHLFLGTKADNTRDMITKGRQPSHRGENNPRAKLSESDVSEIRQLLETSDLSQREIGERFGVAQQTVAHIKVGRTW